MDSDLYLLFRRSVFSSFVVFFASPPIAYPANGRLADRQSYTTEHRLLEGPRFRRVHRFVEDSDDNGVRRTERVDHAYHPRRWMTAVGEQGYK